jgi:PAS domain S-box-containing protein
MNKPLRVLIIEDSADDAALLERELRKGGYDVAAERVETAVTMRAALDRGPWDVIISDHKMPHFSAPEALEVFRASGYDLPFIIVSGTIGEEEAVASMRAGAHDYLMKSKLARLAPSIERALRETEERRQRKQAEAALRQSEAKYRQLHESLTDAFVSVGLDGCILEFNRAYREMLGYTHEELLRLTYIELTPTRWHEAEIRILNEQILAQGSSDVYEKEYIRKDGSVFPVELREFLIRDDAGRPAAIWGIARDITDRKQAETALRESEERFRRIVETAEEGVWQVDRSWRTSYVNRRMEELLGCAPGEMLGQPISAFMDEAGRRATAELQARRQQGQAESHEFRFVRRDGRELLALVATCPILDARGAFDGAIALVGDITARKRAEEALRESETRFRFLVDYSYDLIWTLKPDGVFCYVSPSWKNRLGYDPSDMVGKTIQSLVHPDDVAVCENCMSRVLEARTALPGAAYRVRHADGSWCWHEASMTPTYTGDGSFLYFVGVSRDVTERKRAEDELRKLARAVEQSPVSIIITDRAGNIEFVNPKCMQVTGYTLAEVVGKNPRFLKSGETPAEEYARLWATLSAGQEWRGEFHNKRKDGTLFWESASISPIRGAAGAITHFIAVKEDVTEQKLTQAKFLRAQRVESVGSLASGIAHDLNNILTPIVICADLLQAEVDAARRRGLAQTIGSSALRAVGVVKQLLGFARGREGQKALVQPRHLIGEVVRITRETFPRTIVIEEDCSSDLWPIVADATQLHQVLLNLCINARDAMPAGGRMTLRATNVVLDDHYAAMRKEATPGSYVLIEVSDTGTGIPDTVQGRIFESFFTTKGEGRGTGLGLTTSQGIVRDHGGFITFTSVPGHGTTFTVHLPAQPETIEEARTALVQATIPRGQGALLLVVDDEVGICDVLRKTLESQGYRVLLAQDGIEALAQFSVHSRDVALVVTDFMMPLMDGLTLCRTLRRLNPRLPLLVSSGALPDPERPGTPEAFAAVGNCHLLLKPHTAAALLRAVWNMLHPDQPHAGAARGEPGSDPQPP